MPHEFEVLPAEQMGHVGLLAREEVVDADHVVAVVDELFAEVAAEEAGAAGDEDSLERGHATDFLRTRAVALAGRTAKSCGHGGDLKLRRFHARPHPSSRPAPWAC